MFRKFPIFSAFLTSGIFYFTTLCGVVFNFNLQKANLCMAILVVLMLNFLELNKIELKKASILGCICTLCCLFFNARLISAPLFLIFMIGTFFIGNNKNEAIISKVIIAIGLFFNLSFITNTLVTDVQYDFLSCYNYIEYIVENNFMFWKENPLLTRPSYSAYHPILHFFIAGLFYDVGNLFFNTQDATNEALQIIVLTYMMGYYVVSAKILKLLKFEKLTYITSLGFVVFFPIYNALGGYINNDALLMLLQSLVILFSILYYKEGGKRNLFYIFLFSTLACLTKLSGILILGGVGFIFLLKLWHNRDKKTFLEIFICSLAIFLGILIWPLYQHLVLGIDFRFVPPQEHLSLKQYTMLERFNPIKAILYERMFYNDFGTNLFETMTKTALFGQWDFSSRGKDVMLLIKAMVIFYKIIIASLGVGVLFVILKEYKNKMFWLIFILFVSLLVGQIMFSIKHPYMCNQDFRYVAVLVLIMTCFIGFLLKNIKNNFRYLIYFTILLFEIISLLVWWIVSV